MASDFYTLSSRVPKEVKDRSKHHVAKPVYYAGQRGVVIAKYWRKQTNEILYDVKCCSIDGREPIIHGKVNEAELFDWREPTYALSDPVFYRSERGWIVAVDRNEQGQVLYRIRIACYGGLQTVVHENIQEDQIEKRAK
ncbi:MAG: hypothetical protein M3R08_07765 [Bacteroidota bacterium]|nr:hypothetical protein [Bacteroidota bacterium]